MMHPFSRDARTRRVVVAVLFALSAGACTRPATSHLSSSPRGATGSTAEQAADVELIVAATTDTHGRLRSWDYYANAPEPQRGLTRVAVIIDSLRDANPGRVVLVDAGDLLQGNPLAYVAARIGSDSLRPHPVAAAM